MAQPIQYTDEYNRELRSFIPSVERLVKSGYRLTQFSERELQLKKRCSRCSKVIRPSRPHIQASNLVPADHPGRIMPDLTRDKTLSPQTSSPQTEISEQPPTEDAKTGIAPKAICSFHIGVFQYGKWSCCNNHRSSTGCINDSKHKSYPYKDGELRRNWTLHPTQRPTSMSDHRPAVAIDCEMGTAITGESELIRVTLLDYFTTEILVDALVAPDVQMLHYNTRFSGITKRDMDTARRQKRCLFGRNAARAACMHYVGPNTVIVAHSGYNDLLSLRWIHTDVVDTYVIEAARIRETEDQAAAKTAMEEEIKLQAEADDVDAEELAAPIAEDHVEVPAAGELPVPPQATQKTKKRPKGSGPLALKTMTRELLGIEIQSKDRLGHDSWEDATAARDLVNWFIQQKRFATDDPH